MATAALRLVRDELEQSCHRCSNARHGTNTFCLVFGERIDDEKTAASDCPVYDTEG